MTSNDSLNAQPREMADSEARPVPGEIVAATLELVARRFRLDPAKLTRDARLIEDLGLDGLDLIELIEEVSERFNVYLGRRTDSPDGEIIGGASDVAWPATTIAELAQPVDAAWGLPRPPSPLGPLESEDDSAPLEPLSSTPPVVAPASDGASPGGPTRSAVFERVVAALTDALGIEEDEVHPWSRIVEDLGCDSIDLLDIIFRLEKSFAIRFGRDDFGWSLFARGATVDALIDLIAEKLDAKPNIPGVRDDMSDLLRNAPAFTQWGGSAMPEVWQGRPVVDDPRFNQPLFAACGRNRAGLPRFRRLTDGMRVLLVPGGETTLGSDAPHAAADQRPARRIGLTDFLIDVEPVSNLAFARFLNSIGRVPADVAREWYGSHPDARRQGYEQLKRDWWSRRWTAPAAAESQPVMLVSWYGANAYSLWANRLDWRYYRGDGSIAPALRRRNVKALPPPPPYSLLPSEAQWEYAARGPAGRDPLPSADQACVARHSRGAAYTPSTIPAAPVHVPLGVSPFGLNHMAGNVWQWLRDWYDPTFYSRLPKGVIDPCQYHPTGVRSERGGSWVGPAELARPTYRRARAPIARGRCLGFRCIGLVSALADRNGAPPTK